MDKNARTRKSIFFLFCLMGYSINLFPNTANLNFQSISLDLEDSLGVALELLTDEYGSEVSMTIIDENGTIVASYDEGSLDDETLYNSEYCLGAGCYTFSIADQYGDGICCSFGEGYYELTDSYGQLLGSGGDYGNGDSFEFCLEIIILENLDASIISLEPEGNFCSQNMSPSFTLKNDGESDITEMIFEYALNGELIGEIEWEGNISTFETTTIEIPTIVDLIMGENSLTVNIVSTNGTNDDDISNNTYSNNIDILGDSGFIVHIETASSGYYGGGTKSYILLDNEGNIIDEIVSLGNNANLSLPYCFPEACFSIELSNSAGDGGIEFTVESDAGYMIIESENFADELNTYFCTNPPLNLDASISEIPFPANGSSICGTSLTPVINFFNNGLENVTEIIYEYAYDEASTIQATWTGNLSTFTKAPIVLPEMTGFTAGIHELNVEIISINGQTDEETNNNALSHSFLIIDADSYSLNFTADLTPEENSYQITDDNGNILFSGEQGVFGNPFGTTIKEFCVYAGCYSVTVFDQMGNGGPSVSVTDDNDDIVVEGTLTGPELSLEFCIEGEEEEEEEIVEGINELPITAAIEVFPNPSTGTIYLNHQLEGQYQIIIQDLLGKKVQSQALIIGQNTIYLENTLSNGVYLLTIGNDSEQGVYKITLIK